MASFDAHVRRALDSLPPDLAAKLENVAVVVEPENETDEFAATLNGAYRDRTGDLRLAKPALSQLS